MGLCLSQVVIGVLGCPNLPQSQIRDEDGSGNSAEKAGTDGVGVIFAAQRGAGAFEGPLAGRPSACQYPVSPQMLTAALASTHPKEPLKVNCKAVCFAGPTGVLKYKIPSKVA